MDAYLQRLIRDLPKHNCPLIFAYGSGVFAQSGQSTEGKMLDFVIITDDSQSWHAANLTANRHHYSLLRLLGPKRLSRIQNDYGAGIFYNTLVKVRYDDGPAGVRYIKYGVIETKKLLVDLLDWQHLYVAGRLHKPTKVVHKVNVNDELEQALSLNLRSACHAALLLLPEQFTYDQLFNTIASLSYDGDFRWYLAEDRSKVSKIVQPALDRFIEMYNPVLRSSYFSKTVQIFDQSRSVEQDLSASSILHHLEMLPKTVQLNLQRNHNAKDGRLKDLEDAMVAIAREFEYPTQVRKALKSIVFQSSLRQTVKSFFTAGLIKSISYAGSKFRKMLMSLK